MGTKLTELRNGCFARALDDEPMFVLLARDDSAPGAVDAWADNREADVFAQRRPSSDLEVVAEARACARGMRSWRKANDGKWRTGLFADDPAQPVMPELRGDDAFVSFGKAAGQVVESLRPRTGDAAWDYENANGGCMIAAFHNAADRRGPLDERAKAEADVCQARYGLSDSKRNDIAIKLYRMLAEDEDTAQMAYLAEYKATPVFELLPWYVWFVLIFAAGFIVGRL